MARAFDPYQVLLGIPPTERPLNHYRLLGLPPFESDPDTIAAAARAQMARVSAHLVGIHATAAQELLAELAAAKQVLLSPEKSKYDVALRGELEQTPETTEAFTAPRMGFISAGTARHDTSATSAVAPGSASEGRTLSPAGAMGSFQGGGSVPQHAAAPAAAELQAAADLLPPLARAGGTANSIAHPAAQAGEPTAFNGGLMPASDLLPPAAVPNVATAPQSPVALGSQPVLGSLTGFAPQTPPFGGATHPATLPHAGHVHHAPFAAQAPLAHMAPLVGQLPAAAHVPLAGQIPLAGQAHAAALGPIPAQVPGAAQVPVAGHVPVAGQTPMAYTAQLVGFPHQPVAAAQPAQGNALPMAAPAWPVQAGNLAGPMQVGGVLPAAAEACNLPAPAVQAGLPQLRSNTRPLYLRRRTQASAAAWSILGSLVVVLGLVIYFVATNATNSVLPEDGTAVASARRTSSAGAARADTRDSGGATPDMRPGTATRNGTPSISRPPHVPSNNPQGSPNPQDDSSQPTSDGTRANTSDAPGHSATPAPSGNTPDDAMPSEGMNKEDMPGADTHTDNTHTSNMATEGMDNKDMPEDDTPDDGTPEPPLDDAASPTSTPGNTTAKPESEAPAAVLDALRVARKALAERDLERADQQIDLAIVSAGDMSPELAARIEREQALAAAVRAFWEAVGQSMSQLEGAEELKVADSIAIVVEVDGEIIIIREGGRNQRYSIRRTRNARPLPARLAQALAERWLKADDPSRTLVIGAFLAVDPQGDLAKARDYVQEAEQKGAEAATLVLAALEDEAE